MYRAFVRQKVTKDKLPCKIPCMCYHIYAPVEISAYISLKTHDEPKLLITKCECRKAARSNVLHGNFLPGDDCTRAETCSIIQSVFEEYCY
jgi:hypothetical protein